MQYFKVLLISPCNRTPTDIHTNEQTYRQTIRHTDGWTGRQTGKQTYCKVILLRFYMPNGWYALHTSASMKWPARSFHRGGSRAAKWLQSQLSTLSAHQLQARQQNEGWKEHKNNQPWNCYTYVSYERMICHLYYQN